VALLFATGVPGFTWDVARWLILVFVVLAVLALIF
jgi:hypothetical protein